MRKIKNIIFQKGNSGAKLFLLSLCICGITFISCSKKEEKIPENILSKEKMIKIMVDVQLAEASIQNRNLNMTDSAKMIAAGYYKNLFEKNRVTEQQFRESFLYYSRHLDMLNKIYEEVINELSKKQTIPKGKIIN